MVKEEKKTISYRTISNRVLEDRGWSRLCAAACLSSV